MNVRKIRRYRQDDQLYDLIGKLATQLSTNRTTVVDMAVHALAEGIVPPRRELREMAHAIDEVRRQVGLDAALDERIRLGMATRREPETVGS